MGTIRARWAGIKGDQRTVDDAKLRLLKQLGAALRKVSDKIDTTPLYERLFELSIEEPSYSIRLAMAQEFGTGGNAAFAVIRERVGLNSDPVLEYNDRLSELKAWKRQQYEVWSPRMQRARAADASSRAASLDHIRRLQRDRQEINRSYRKQRVDLLREFVMRAWMLPMLLGSVDEAHRDEARERLTKWLRHLDPAFTGGTPDLPLALESALAQGFKYAANRRKRHPHTYPGGRAELIRQAETVLPSGAGTRSSSCPALCLWELPAVRHTGPTVTRRPRPERRGRPGPLAGHPHCAPVLPQITPSNCPAARSGYGPYHLAANGSINFHCPSVSCLRVTILFLPDPPFKRTRIEKIGSRHHTGPSGPCRRWPAAVPSGRPGRPRRPCSPAGTSRRCRRGP
ncbi:hypothetical protein SALBM311S_13025 [Streptomyces alboniger]